MHRLFLTLSVLGVLLVHVGGAGGRDSYREWLTFNEVTLDGHKRVLSRHDIRPAAESLSPDRKHLAYVPYVSEGVMSRELWIADVRAPRRRLLMRAPGSIWGVAWAPNGRTIALTLHSRAQEAIDGIWLVEVDGSNLRRVVEDALSPAWSPDSRQLAYIRLDANGLRLIHILDVATGLSRALVSGDVGPWSPDGRKILVWRGCVFHCSDDFGVVTVSSGRGRLLGPGRTASWSPDSRQIAYVAPAGRDEQLRRVRADAGRPRFLAHGAGQIVWSPNGKWIAFTRPPSPVECRESIHVVPAKGGKTRRLAVETRRIQPLAWNRGRFLYQATKCFG